MAHQWPAIAKSISFIARNFKLLFVSVHLRTQIHNHNNLHSHRANASEINRICPCFQILVFRNTGFTNAARLVCQVTKKTCFLPDQQKKKIFYLLPSIHRWSCAIIKDFCL